jgi:hypothetical protein
MLDEDRRFSHPVGPPPQRSAELEFIMAQLARLPTRRELAKIRLRAYVRRHGAGDRGDGGILALPADMRSLSLI